jgi:hypothetical protein
MASKRVSLFRPSAFDAIQSFGRNAKTTAARMQTYEATWFHRMRSPRNQRDAIRLLMVFAKKTKIEILQQQFHNSLDESHVSAK